MARLEVYYENNGSKIIPCSLLLITHAHEINAYTNCFYFKYNEFELKHISKLDDNSSRIIVEQEDIKSYRWSSGYLALSIPRIWKRLNTIMLKEKNTVLRLYEPTEYLLVIDDVNDVCSQTNSDWINIDVD